MFVKLFSFIFQSFGRGQIFGMSIQVLNFFLLTTIRIIPRHIFVLQRSNKKPNLIVFGVLVSEFPLKSIDRRASESKRPTFFFDSQLMFEKEVDFFQVRSTLVSHPKKSLLKCQLIDVTIDSDGFSSQIVPVCF